MGAVNMMALEEYNECEQRFTFLTRERDDLLQSITDTQQAIKELELITKDRFEQAFAAINTNFNHRFPNHYSGGGTAENARLTKSTAPAMPGIDIVASASGQAIAKRPAALRRRKSNDRPRAAHRHFQISAKPLLHPRRS